MATNKTMTRLEELTREYKTLLNAYRLTNKKWLEALYSPQFDREEKENLSFAAYIELGPVSEAKTKLIDYIENEYEVT